VTRRAAASPQATGHFREVKIYPPKNRSKTRSKNDAKNDLENRSMTLASFFPLRRPSKSPGRPAAGLATASQRVASVEGWLL
jgi:hypothetical protein